VALRISHFLKIRDDAICDTPPDEVELGDRRRQTLEIDPGRSTKRIEQLLAVAIQTRLVGDMDREHLAVGSGIRDVLSLGIVCHEPFQFSE
jgi:hypothetical protein